MAESMKDFERELEASFKRIDERDIISGTVVSVDESGVVLDLKFYAEGLILKRLFSRGMRFRRWFFVGMMVRGIFFFPERTLRMCLPGTG